MGANREVGEGKPLYPPEWYKEHFPTISARDRAQDMALMFNMADILHVAFLLKMDWIVELKALGWSAPQTSDSSPWIVRSVVARQETP